MNQKFVSALLLPNYLWNQPATVWADEKSLLYTTNYQQNHANYKRANHNPSPYSHPESGPPCITCFSHTKSMDKTTNLGTITKILSHLGNVVAELCYSVPRCRVNNMNSCDQTSNLWSLMRIYGDCEVATGSRAGRHALRGGKMASVDNNWRSNF